MAADYNIVSTQPYTYLDETSQVVEGYRVYFNIPEFNETHFVQVPNLNPDTVSKAITGIITDRKNLSTQ
jgi:hypothetical protein